LVGPPWEAPTGPEAYQVHKELRAAGNHVLREVWEDNLALKVHALLDSMRVEWTSTDVVRIGNTGESSAPIILWIGVMPASLSGDDGVIVVSKCLDLLREKNITDVEVEIRESVVIHSDGPRFLTPDFDLSPICEPLTLTLGIPICAQARPLTGGTGGFFIAEGGRPERLLLVTARHVVFKPDRNENKHFECTDDSQPYNVALFDEVAFEEYLQPIETEIQDQAIIASIMGKRLAVLQGRDDLEANAKRQKAQAELDNARKAQKALQTFHQDVLTHWNTLESRLVDHVILSPPISVGYGSQGYTEDWAVIEMNTSKIDTKNYQGNCIDLGNRFSPPDFTRMVYPHSQNDDTFGYPYDRLLKLKDTIPDEEMRNPTTLDQNGNPCLVVIKRGKATGLTIGCANNIISYSRYYYDKKSEISKEWSILPYDTKSGEFSARGDSGSVIVDGLGRIGGLLTGGSGDDALPTSFDIAYATPISFLLKRMQDNGLHNLNINPTLDVRQP